MDPRKQAIIDTLIKFMSQRPNLAQLGYRGNWAAWRKETREVARDRREASLMLRQIELADSITADTMLRIADRGGRLTIRPSQLAGPGYAEYCVDYTAGRSYGHEFRGAVARYAASVLWDYVREQCMPPVGTAPCGSGKAKAGEYFDGKKSVSAGDWLRAHFRKQFGRGMASRWFN